MSVAPPPKQRKPKQDASETVREKNRALRAQVEHLREVLEMDEPRKLDDWVQLPIEMRDELATRALWQTWGDQINALQMLGFNGRATKGAQLAEMKSVVFGTAGVRAKLERSFEEGDANRALTVKRLAGVVANGSEEAAVRAAQVLTKLEGWNKEKEQTVHQNINLWTLTAGAQEAAQGKPLKNATPAHALPPDDPFVVLGHEPGAPIKFGSEEEVE